MGHSDSVWYESVIFKLFHDGGANHEETSLLLCIANQWTTFYMKGTSVIKELRVSNLFLIEFILIWPITTLKGVVFPDSRSLKSYSNSRSLIIEPKEAFF